ncbi:MAG: glutamate-1-semialdehyde 2,1-aminomutase [Bacteroidia bacterium]|nr:glutamate-1-semialdehyde 2,1-aminomutase [Bacteroidia bacterium]
MKRTESEKLFEKAKNYFPGGVNSPVRAFRSVGGTPLFIEKGKGSKLFDADGNEFIDYCCSWGPLISGHANPVVVEAITRAAMDGTSFGAPTRKENELAELILSNHRYIEMLRFVSSGTEAVMSAIRLARGVTKRAKILKFEGCYHGHVDALLVKAGSGLVTFGNSSSDGIPEAVVKETITIPLDDENLVEEAFTLYGDDIAAIIIEPVPANNGLLLQRKSFLEFLRKITQQYGSLLIFDEVINGFRIGFEGASGYYAIQPDIITFGKIIGGGLPVGAYGASAEIMRNISPEGKVYQAGTLSGNPMAMAAGKAQLGLCLQPGFYEGIAQKCEQLSSSLEAHALSRGLPFKVIRIASIFWIAFSDLDAIRTDSQIDPKSMENFKKLHAFLLENGVYLGPSGYEVGFVSSAHTDEDISYTLSKMKQGLDLL